MLGINGCKLTVDTGREEDRNAGVTKDEDATSDEEVNRIVDAGTAGELSRDDGDDGSNMVVVSIMDVLVGADVRETEDIAIEALEVLESIEGDVIRDKGKEVSVKLEASLAVTDGETNGVEINAGELEEELKTVLEVEVTVAARLELELKEGEKNGAGVLDERLLQYSRRIEKNRTQKHLR